VGLEKIKKSSHLLRFEAVAQKMQMPDDFADGMSILFGMDNTGVLFAQVVMVENVLVLSE